LILKELNAIDWHSMNAEQVPVWIIGLTSADSSIRLHSFGELSRYFCLHDAGLSVFVGYKQLLSSEAPIVATPFLIALLPSSHVEVKRTLLDILFEIANYRHRPYSDEVQQERANKLYDYLLQQFDVFLPFLDTDDSWVKEAAISLISAFEEKDAFVVDLLLKRIDADWRYQRMDASEKTAVASAIGRKIHSKSILYQQFSQRFELILQRWIENSWFEDISVQAVAAY
jgi:hypothetical protein